MNSTIEMMTPRMNNTLLYVTEHVPPKQKTFRAHVRWYGCVKSG